MRTEKIKIYKFNELTDEAKEKAIEDYRNTDNYFFGSENEASLKAFENIFPILIGRWSYGGDRGDGISFSMECDIAELSGQRLATYIWNNYRDQIYKGKYYSSRAVPTGRTTPPMINYKYRYSKCTLEEGYNLTGYCADEYLLQPIFDFLKQPVSTMTFEDLMRECLDEWIDKCTKDVEYQYSDEYIEDTLEANEYEFYETGEIY